MVVNQFGVVLFHQVVIHRHRHHSPRHAQSVVGHDAELPLVLHHFQGHGTYHGAHFGRHYMNGVSRFAGIIQQVVVSYHLVGILLQLLLHPSVGFSLKRPCFYFKVKFLLLAFQPRAFGGERGIREEARAFVEWIVVGKGYVAQRVRLTRKRRHQFVRYLFIRKETCLVAHHGREGVRVCRGGLRERNEHPSRSVGKPNVVVVVFGLENAGFGMLRWTTPSKVNALHKTKHTLHRRHGAWNGLAKALLSAHCHPSTEHTRHRLTCHPHVRSHKSVGLSHTAGSNYALVLGSHVERLLLKAREVYLVRLLLHGV